MWWFDASTISQSVTQGPFFVGSSHKSETPSETPASVKLYRPADGYLEHRKSPHRGHNLWKGLTQVVARVVNGLKSQQEEVTRDLRAQLKHLSEELCRADAQQKSQDIQLSEQGATLQQSEQKLQDALEHCAVLEHALQARQLTAYQQEQSEQQRHAEEMQSLVQELERDAQQKIAAVELRLAESERCHLQELQEQLALRQEEQAAAEAKFATERNELVAQHLVTVEQVRTQGEQLLDQSQREHESRLQDLHTQHAEELACVAEEKQTSKQLLAQERKKFSSQSSRLQEEIKGHKKDIAKLLKQYAALQNQRDREEHKRLAERKLHEANCHQLRSSLEKKETRLQSRRAQISALASQLRNQHSSQAKVDKEVASEQAELRNQLQAAQEQLERLSLEKSKLEFQAVIYVEALHSLQGQANLLRQESQACGEDRMHLAKQLAEETQARKRSELEFGRVEELHSQAEQQAKQLAEELGGEKTIGAHWRKEAEGLEQRYRTLHCELVNERQRCANVEAECGRLRQVEANLQVQQREQQQANQSLQARCAEFEAWQASQGAEQEEQHQQHLEVVGELRQELIHAKQGAEQTKLSLRKMQIRLKQTQAKHVDFQRKLQETVAGQIQQDAERIADLEHQVANLKDRLLKEAAARRKVESSVHLLSVNPRHESIARLIKHELESTQKIERLEQEIASTRQYLQYIQQLAGTRLQRARQENANLRQRIVGIEVTAPGRASQGESEVA